MRKVKVRMKDLEQVGAALERLRADNTRKIEECFEADRRFKELAEAGKIQEVTNFCADQHLADLFFWKVYPLKPIPARLA